jgi:hypothetical protein
MFTTPSSFQYTSMTTCPSGGAPAADISVTCALGFATNHPLNHSVPERPQWAGQRQSWHAAALIGAVTSVFGLETESLRASTENPHMSTAIKWILAASLIGASGTATAQVTYDYSGSNFDVVSGQDTTSDSVQGSFTVSSALAPNLAEADITPSSFAFSDGVQSIKGAGCCFSIFTNASGQIDAWNISIFLPSNGVIGINSPNIDLGAPGEPTIYDLVHTGGNETSVASSDRAGVWTSHIAAPEIDPASAASGLTLLAGALVVLRGRRPQRLAA